MFPALVVVDPEGAGVQGAVARGVLIERDHAGDVVVYALQPSGQGAGVADHQGDIQQVAVAGYLPLHGQVGIAQRSAAEG